jgi:phosphoglycerol transferase MdoB-like AlkP superfamily enzyme
MIQRQQTLWLLLCIVCTSLSFILPFFEYVNENNTATTGSSVRLDAGSTSFLFILSALSIILSLVTIFRYKNRKLQIRLCIAGIGISILILILFFVEMKKSGGSFPSLPSLFTFAVPISYFMAARGIWKDKRLVKSLDKLR